MAKEAMLSYIRNFSDKFRRFFTKRNVAILIGIVIIFLIYIYFITPVDCGTDTNCFDSHAKTCSLSKVIVVSEGNKFNYEIRGSSQDSCIINIKALSISNAYPIEMKNKLENRSMVCGFPANAFTSASLSKIDKTIDNCTGPLKEGMLELIIQRMYAVIVQNMGRITVGFEDVLKATNKTS